MKLLRYCLIVLLMAAVPSLYAKPNAEATPAHLAAVRQMFEAASLQQFLTEGMKKGVGNMLEISPAQAEAASQFFKEITMDEVIDKLTSFYAKYISRNHALEIARFYQSPTGIKCQQITLNAIRNGTKVLDGLSTLNKKEMQALHNFAQSPAGRAFLNTQPLASEEIKRIFYEWGMESQRKRMQQGFAPLLNEMEATLKEANGEAKTTISSPSNASTGVAYLDQVISIATESIRRIGEVNKQFEAEMNAIGLETLLAPSNLVAKAGIEEGRQKVQRLDDKLEQYIKTVSNIQQEAHHRVKAFDFPPQSREQLLARFEAGLTHSYDWFVRYSENQRTLIDLFRRMLSFSESRLGKVKYANDQLVFDEQADLDIYQTLWAQLVAETKRETELQKERTDMFKESL